MKGKEKNGGKISRKPGQMTMNALLHITGPGHYSTMEMSIKFSGIVFSHL